jgi:tRNA A-37 threonylcarbamoyl transferase component Bud32
MLIGMADQITDEFLGFQAALKGRYSLQRELGRGGMGTVYLAQDVALDRPVAIKLLLPHLARQPELKQRFLNEARTAAKLSHPNIIPIFTVDEADGFVFFVMAFVDGETLEQRIRGRGPLPASDFARILREVSWALGYAHAQGVVHRDVKADNIMIERPSGRALVVDFGIARTVQNTGVTGESEILGTANYMSPEQASGEIADHRSDIYSLGVVSFYALSGRLPFEGATVAVVLAKHITQPAPPMAGAVSRLPSKLSDAVDRCLAKSPAERFATAEELADDVGAALASRREAPAAIRSAVKKMTELTQNLVWISFFQAFFIGIGALDATTQLQVFRDVWFFFAALGFVAEPIVAAGILVQVRSLLKTGYTRDDLVAAWDREVQGDAAERAAEYGRGPGFAERVARWANPVGWSTMVVSAVMGGATTSSAAMAVGSFGLMTSFYGGLISLWRYDGRTALSRRLTGAFVKSRLGRWVFELAGKGLDRSALASMATHRPTELVIGMAVDSLFDALPKATRQQLAELPSIVRHLEANAMKMRQNVEALSQHGEALDHDLGAARDVARHRLGEAVTALETIRLDLLRLTAGAGSVDSLTADLAQARAASAEVGRLLAAKDEIRDLLPSTSFP